MARSESAFKLSISTIEHLRARGDRLIALGWPVKTRWITLAETADPDGSHRCGQRATAVSWSRAPVGRGRRNGPLALEQPKRPSFRWCFFFENLVLFFVLMANNRTTAER